MSDNRPPENVLLAPATPAAVGAVLLAPTETLCFDTQPHLDTLFQSHRKSELPFSLVSPKKFREVFNELQSPQNTIECEQDVQKPQKRLQNCTSSSLQTKHRRQITLSKDTLGEEEKYLVCLTEKTRKWKHITASYNKRFSKKATQEALQMRLKRIKDETKVWTDDEVRAFLSINRNPMVTTLTLFLAQPPLRYESRKPQCQLGKNCSQG